MIGKDLAGRDKEKGLRYSRKHATNMKRKMCKGVRGLKCSISS
jgi:hypothetical protein